MMCKVIEQVIECIWITVRTLVGTGVGIIVLRMLELL